MAVSVLESPVLADVLLEDTWEGSDIMEECARRGIPCQELTVDALAKYDPTMFVQHTFMCNTEIVQKHLRSAGLAYKVPDTYPAELESLLQRRIEHRKLHKVAEGDLPLFIKPTSNDKAFDGVVVRDAEHLQSIRDDARSADDVEVYISETVTFLVEYRLFLGGGKIYGMGEHYLRDGDRSAGVPAVNFVQEVLACVGDAFMAVDVGLMTKDGQCEVCEAVWAVVEVNPPFALDDCGLAIEPYVQFCADACAYVRRP